MKGTQPGHCALKTLQALLDIGPNQYACSKGEIFRPSACLPLGRVQCIFTAKLSNCVIFIRPRLYTVRAPPLPPPRYAKTNAACGGP